MIFDFIRIENGSDTALWRQIYEQFAAAVDGGRIAPLTRLPSIRELAAGLSVSRSPVENAYERLHLDGYIVSRPKSGCFTAPPPLLRGAASRPQASLKRGMTSAPAG